MASGMTPLQQIRDTYFLDANPGSVSVMDPRLQPAERACTWQSLTEIGTAPNNDGRVSFSAPALMSL